MIVAIAIVAIVLAGVVVYLLSRGAVKPDSAEATKQIQDAGDRVVAAAQQQAAAIADAPQSEIDARVEALRARGRSGQ